MIGRRILGRVLQVLQRSPAVVLLGPRQVGKTTLAHEVGASMESIYLDLESPADRSRLDEPELYLERHRDKLVILDEVQRVPDLFQVLRGVIDRNRRAGKGAGQFLLLGSASLDLMKQSGESLAGRVSYLELGPLDVTELPAERRDDLWVRGGFPDSLLADDDPTSFEWRLDFIRTYLERDVPALGPRIPAETLRRFWTMLAHRQGGLFNASELGRSLGVTAKTTTHYLDLMVDLLLVRRLKPWSSNAGKRLVRAPKVYLRDSGLLHALLQLRDAEEILGHPIAGPSWEALVIENILALSGPSTDASFYRTSAGAEVDLVLSSPKHKPWAFEVKRSLTPKPRRGFHIACDDLEAERRFVVYPGQESYPLSDDVMCVSLGDLPDVLSQLR